MRHLSTRAALAAALLGGACAASAADAPAAPAPAPKPVRVVATIFPAWDWTREVLGARNDGVELTLLLDDGVDLHSYQPTAEDVRKVAESDLFVYVGGESDEWVAPALAAAPNPRRKVLNLLEALGDAGKADALGAKSLLVLEGAKHRIAETVRAATKAKDQSIAVFDSLQSTTAAEAAAGKTYLDAMRRNRAALAEALK